jgi:hypothetical protein
MANNAVMKKPSQAKLGENEEIDAVTGAVMMVAKGHPRCGDVRYPKGWTPPNISSHTAATVAVLAVGSIPYIHG